MEKKTSKKKQEYCDRYHREQMTPIAFRFSNKNDKDILDHLSKQKNKSDYIRQLIRADMNKGK